MIIGLSTQLVPNLLVQIAIIMAIKVDFSGLTESVVYSSLALTVVMVVWRLLLVVVLHVTNREREFDNPFHHTPLIMGAQWMANRKPMDLAERDRPTPRRPTGGRARMQPTPGGWDDGFGERGYDDDELEPPGTVEAEGPRRSGAREAMVRFRFAPEDVGGLDREFIEQG